MEAQRKTKKQLSEEVKALRHQIAELQTLEAAHRQAEEVRQKARNKLELRVQEQAAELVEAHTALRDSSLKYEQAQETYESFKKELEFTYEELELVKEELNSAYLEGQINLKALEVINYELRFANQEKQVLNQEKQVLNADVYRGAAELKRLNTFLNSVLMNLHAGMVIVDQQLRILTWNRGAERLWGVLAEEVQGQSFLQLDIGLPVAQLSKTLRSCLAGEGARQEVMLEATNSRLQAITCRVTCTPLYGAGRENLGAILLMEPIRTS